MHMTATSIWWKKTYKAMQTEGLRIHVFRLLPGQGLKEAIQAYVAEAAIEAGWVMTCVGSLTRLHLRLANQDTGTAQEGHFEIVSLVGTVSMHGCHLHLCASSPSGATTGGHLLDGNLAYTTAEVVIGEAPGLVFTRENDGTTDWAELQIRRRD